MLSVTLQTIAFIVLWLWNFSTFLKNLIHITFFCCKTDLIIVFLLSASCAKQHIIRKRNWQHWNCSWYNIFSAVNAFFKNNYSHKWFISTQAAKTIYSQNLKQNKKRKLKNHKFWLQLKGIKNAQELQFFSNSKLHFAFIHNFYNIFISFDFLFLLFMLFIIKSYYDYLHSQTEFFTHLHS